MLIPIGEAVDREKYYETPDLEKRYAKLSSKEEITRAETIVNALEGLTIDSAQELLKKVNKYILQSLVAK